jgi:hypothetical protein
MFRIEADVGKALVIGENDDNVGPTGIAWFVPDCQAGSEKEWQEHERQPKYAGQHSTRERLSPGNDTPRFIIGHWRIQKKVAGISHAFLLPPRDHLRFAFLNPDRYLIGRI